MYNKDYYLANRDRMLAYQKAYQQRKKAKLAGQKECADKSTRTFNISFLSVLKNIEEMYNALLAKNNELMKENASLKLKIKEMDVLKKELAKTNEWKNKIKNFFSI